MVSTITAELMRRQEERTEFLVSALYRQKDVAVRKCLKCGCVYFDRVNIDDAGDTVNDANVIFYCMNCLTSSESEEIEIG